MSFKLFVYYCALCGGWAALFGWAIGKLLAPEEGDMQRAIIQALALGLLVALALGIVDAFMNLSSRQVLLVGARGLVTAAIGCLAGLVGGALGQLLVNKFKYGFFIIIGWTLMGLLIGFSTAVYDMLIRLFQAKNIGGGVKKILNGLIGGTLGGFLGGILFLIVRFLVGKINVSLQHMLHEGESEKHLDELLSSSAIGFVALGACIGLLVALAQIILKEAWVKVEAGFRAGRELMLSKAETTIGRAESCDIGLFGDNGIERMHARIVQKGDGYLLADAGTPGGTFLNGQRIGEPSPLHSGDSIGVGRSVIRFMERQKK